MHGGQCRRFKRKRTEGSFPGGGGGVSGGYTSGGGGGGYSSGGGGMPGYRSPALSLRSFAGASDWQGFDEGVGDTFAANNMLIGRRSED